MSITIPPELEVRLRSQAETEGLSVEACLERLVRSHERAEAELTTLALEGLASGIPLEVIVDYWQEKHRRLDEALKKTGLR